MKERGSEIGAVEEKIEGVQYDFVRTKCEDEETVCRKLSVAQEHNHIQSQKLLFQIQITIQTKAIFPKLQQQNSTQTSSDEICCIHNKFYNFDTKMS